jgi:hypothetical protein
VRLVGRGVLAPLTVGVANDVPNKVGVAIGVPRLDSIVSKELSDSSLLVSFCALERPLFFSLDPTLTGI